MPKRHSRDAAREILKIIPLVMRTVAAELRAAGELPAPAHFGLLTMLSVQPRTLSAVKRNWRHKQQAGERTEDETSQGPSCNVHIYEVSRVAVISSMRNCTEKMFFP